MIGRLWQLVTGWCVQPVFPDTLALEIEPGDITGARHSCTSCPLARALRRAYPGSLVLVAPWPGEAHVFAGRMSRPPRRYVLDDVGIDLVKRFDLGLTIHPHVTVTLTRIQ